MIKFIKKIWKNSKEVAVGATLVTAAIVSLSPDSTAPENNDTNNLSMKIASNNDGKWTEEQTEAYVKKYSIENNLMFSNAKKELLFNKSFLEQADARYVESALRIERKKAEARGEKFEYCLDSVKPIIIKSGDMEEKKGCVKVRPQR